jgi:hypothetical protein
MQIIIVLSATAIGSVTLNSNNGTWKTTKYCPPAHPIIFGGGEKRPLVCIRPIIKVRWLLCTSRNWGLPCYTPYGGKISCVPLCLPHDQQQVLSKLIRASSHLPATKATLLPPHCQHQSATGCWRLSLTITGRSGRDGDFNVRFPGSRNMFGNYGGRPQRSLGLPAPGAVSLPPPACDVGLLLHTTQSFDKAGGIFNLFHPNGSKSLSAEARAVKLVLRVKFGSRRDEIQVTMSQPMFQGQNMGP